MAGKFETFVDKGGKFRFRLKAGNGEIILTSQGYAARRDRDNGIESVRKNSAIPERFEKSKSDGGKFHFNLKSSNGQVVATSQSYDSESGCSNGIQSVANNAPGAAVVEQSA